MLHELYELIISLLEHNPNIIVFLKPKRMTLYDGIKKTIPNFLRALRKNLFYTLIRDKNNSSLHKAEIQGLVASYFLRKSSRRPKISL